MADPIRELLSQTSYDTDGTTTVWNFSFAGGYIERAHVKVQLMDKVTLNIVQVPITEANFIGDFQLQLIPAFPVGSELTIYRDSPKDLPLVNFTDKAALTESSLDLNARQAIFVAAESSDMLGTNLEAVSKITTQVEFAREYAEQSGLSADAAFASAAAAAASAASIVGDADRAEAAAADADAKAAAASASAAAALASQSAAAGSASAASASQTAAAGSASAASTSATNASTSATNAANSASAAGASQTAAATSATNAANSATAASGSAATATAQAGIATTKAAEAAASAASIDTTYLLNRANHTGTQPVSTLTGTLPVANGGTGVTTSTGAGNAVLSDSPALTGTPTAPTAAADTSTTQIASTEFTMTALNARQRALGDSQTLQTMGSARAPGVTYTNSTGRTIFVTVRAATSAVNATLTILLNGVTASNIANPFTSGEIALSLIVPAGATYRVNEGTGASTNLWRELR